VHWILSREKGQKREGPGEDCEESDGTSLKKPLGGRRENITDFNKSRSFGGKRLSKKRNVNKKRTGYTRGGRGYFRKMYTVMGKISFTSP